MPGSKDLRRTAAEKLFRTLDIDGNNSLCHDEIEHYFALQGINFSKRMRKSILR